MMELAAPVKNPHNIIWVHMIQSVHHLLLSFLVSFKHHVAVELKIEIFDQCDKPSLVDHAIRLQVLEDHF